MKRVRAYGPAGVGNVAAGFDVLGAAVAPAGGEPWGDVVEVRELAARPAGADPGVSLVCDGPFAHQLPADPAANLAVKTCAAFARRLGRRLPRLSVRLTKGLPVGSGLGSSSATVVATIRALDALLDRPLDDAGLLAVAGDAEAHAAGAPHLDNVAAALLGGLRLVDPDGRARALPFPDELRFVLAVPALTLTTRAARAALPAAVPLGLAVAHAQNLAALVHALHAGDRELLRGCLRDLLAEPHRAGLVRGFRQVQAAGLAAGAWGCSLSGAGPAVFALAEAGAAPAVGEAMRRAWEGAGVAAAVKLCVLDRQGARLLGPGEFPAGAPADADPSGGEGPEGTCG
ncbi:MAG: homoserine kinase [Acidobacteria bacterium]|nr:homoserine kinase [Acidobacteriota bacterium]